MDDVKLTLSSKQTTKLREFFEPIFLEHTRSRRLVSSSFKFSSQLNQTRDRVSFSFESNSHSDFLTLADTLQDKSLIRHWTELENRRFATRMLRSSDVSTIDAAELLERSDSFHLACVHPDFAHAQFPHDAPIRHHKIRERLKTSTVELRPHQGIPHHYLCLFSGDDLAKVRVARSGLTFRIQAISPHLYKHKVIDERNSRPYSEQEKKAQRKRSQNMATIECFYEVSFDFSECASATIVDV